LQGLQPEPTPPGDILGARALGVFGDSVTTDHISPAGSIAVDSPAGEYLIGNDVLRRDFNSFGARRGNHEVMIRGTFGNVRLRNLLVPDQEGDWTIFQGDGEFTGEKMRIYYASLKYQEAGTPLVVLGGKEYGTGSSRDWAAKGTLLLGIRAVLVESFERIHRTNLVGMGVLPVQFLPGETRETHGPGRHGDLRHHRAGRRVDAGDARHGARPAGERRGDGVPGAGAAGYAAGRPLLPARGDPAVCDAVADAGLRVEGRKSKGGRPSPPPPPDERTMCGRRPPLPALGEGVFCCGMVLGSI
jgi:hypothetical protein